MSEYISNSELIRRALAVMHPVQVDDDWHGDVAAALITPDGNIYTGVCVDVPSGTGFCAERSAIAQMFAHGEQQVARIVAVWNNNPAGDVYVLPPCGACRMFMAERLQNGLDTEVLLDVETTMQLRELYPYHEWPQNKVVLQD